MDSAKGLCACAVFSRCVSCPWRFVKGFSVKITQSDKFFAECKGRPFMFVTNDEGITLAFFGKMLYSKNADEIPGFGGADLRISFP